MIHHALRLAAAGFRCFPVTTDGTKRPLVTSWQNLATTNEKHLRSWWDAWPSANIGIACGRGSNLVVIDVDDVDAAADVMDRLPATLTMSTPRGGLHFYFRMPEHMDDDDVIRNVQGRKDSDPLGRGVDVRGEGGYVLGEGSTQGKAGPWYEVANPSPIVEVPEWVLERLRKAKRHIPMPMPAWTPDFTVGGLGAEERARRYMAKMPGAVSGAAGHTTTMKVARVLVTRFGLDDGTTRALLDEYNTRCEPRWSDRELDHKVKQARNTPDPRGNATGHGMVPSLLMDHQIDGTDPFNGEEIVCEAIEAPRPAPTYASNPDEAQWALLEQVRALGGLCESFPSWVLAGADYPQPGLTVGATLALGAAVSARRFVYGRAVGTLFLCAVAPTASGKGRPQACVSQALRSTWAHTIGASDLSSTPSTIKRIQAATLQSTGLCLVLDEYGPRLKVLLDNKGGGHQRDMRALILTLATIGTGDYVAAMSLTKGGDDLVITAPALTIYGSSTAVALHDAIGRMALEDGLLGRHLFVEALSVLPQRQPFTPGTEDVPAEIRNAIDEIRKAHLEWHKSLPPLGNSEKGDPLYLYRPDEIEDDGGQDILDAFAARCDERRRTPEQDDVAPELLGRAAEHAARVCVGLATLRAAHPALPLVDRDVARCAVAIVEASLATVSRSMRDHQADGDWERQTKRVVAALRRHGEAVMPWTALLRAVGGIRTGDLEEVVSRLVAEGRAEVLKEAGKTKPQRAIRLLEE